MAKNTAYRVHVEDVNQTVVNNVNIENGATLKIKSHGGGAKIWDIIYFIQKTQNAQF
jgi:hypothetical protein